MIQQKHITNELSAPWEQGTCLPSPGPRMVPCAYKYSNICWMNEDGARGHLFHYHFGFSHKCVYEPLLRNETTCRQRNVCVSICKHMCICVFVLW